MSAWPWDLRRDGSRQAHCGSLVGLELFALFLLHQALIPKKNQHYHMSRKFESFGKQKPIGKWY